MTALLPSVFGSNASPTGSIPNSAMHFSVAPMLDWTDPHCRHFHRQLSKHAWLYSEMVTTGALLYGKNLPRFLQQDPTDHPVVLQLGGSDPHALAQCAALAAEWGYCEVNLNVGCPSDRVQNNQIGACLMAHPSIVAEAVAAMKTATHLPITVKCRLGIDHQNEGETLVEFVSALDHAKVDGIILHARKAWLQGISPKENREIPPLRYELVHQIKAAFAHLPIALNGGIKQLEEGVSHLHPSTDLPALNGFMMGRAIYENPFILSKVDSQLYGMHPASVCRFTVVEQLFPYIEAHLAQGGKLMQVCRHMLGLFYGMPGGRLWRRHLSEKGFGEGAGLSVLREAMQLVRNEQDRARESSQPWFEPHTGETTP
ncbi:MAG: tRNA dihydrouridine(20/20a) synthase DusA [Thiotrichales bacterium]|nr:tRNA dihydrouridine(20/20a) synthase DusA [Thiotrichales bacterium]